MNTKIALKLAISLAFIAHLGCSDESNGPTSPDMLEPENPYTDVSDAGLPVDADEVILVLTEADTSRVAEIPVGRRFQILLVSNITTGYGWQFEEPIGDGLVTLLDREFIGSENPLELYGAPGHEQWTLRTVAKGVGVISLVYVRPWDPESVWATIAFRIRVK